jgi:hypothetical protein
MHFIINFLGLIIIHFRNSNFKIAILLLLFKPSFKIIMAPPNYPTFKFLPILYHRRMVLIFITLKFHPQNKFHAYLALFWFIIQLIKINLTLFINFYLSKLLFNFTSKKNL